MMNTANEDFLALMDGLVAAAKSGGIFQRMLDEAPNIGVLLIEFRERARREARSPGLPPCVNPPADESSARASAISELLSPRQCDIVKLIAGGRSNKQIARIVGVTPETVKSHVKNIFTKLSVENRAQAVSRAQSLGLVGFRVDELIQYKAISQLDGTM
jgi:LuxR family maltose regulon positive regulatory protein